MTPVIKQEKSTATLIIQAAERLFLEKSYEVATMNMLADYCGFTKRTIYRYFSCKEDLYFAVLLKGNQSLRQALFKEIPEKPSFEDFRRFIYAYRDYFFTHEAFFELMSLIKPVRMKKDVSGLPYFIQYEKFAGAFHRDCIALYQRVNHNMAPEEASSLALVFIFIVQGLFHMLIQSGERFTSYFQLDREIFTAKAIDFLMKGLG